MTQREAADFLLGRLAPWGAYLYHEAKTGSIYVKFPHWKLGSIRIGDHRGKRKYHYRWRVRLDLPDAWAKYRRDGGVLACEVGPGQLEWLVGQFEKVAVLRGVHPGDRQAWGDRPGGGTH